MLRLFYSPDIYDPDNQQFPLQQLLCFLQNPVYSTMYILILWHHLLKITTFICYQFLNHMKEIDPGKNLTGVIVFDGASNVQLGGELLKVHYQNLKVMCGVEHTVSLFFNDVLKIPISSFHGDRKISMKA